MPQAILPATAHESISHPSSPRSSLANMTIGGLDELSSDIPRLDQRGTDTPAVKLMQNSHHMDQNGRRSVHGLFFIDEVGSRVAVDKNLDPPKHPHAVSPLPSDSGEEVIVFEGRRRIAQNTLQHRPPLAGKSSRNSNRDYHFPRTNGQLNSSILGTTQTPSTGPAPPCQPQQPVQPDNIVSDYRYSNVHRGQPAKEKTSDSIKLSRTGWRKQRRSKKNARLAAKEDEILADYIEHMNDEAELDIAFSSLTQKGGLVDESSIDLESQAKTEGDATDIAAGLPPPGQYNRDLNVTRGIDEGFNFHASTDGESDKSVDEALIAADVQKCMDDIEDERDLLERKQARMTDEQVARLLSKQEELGFTSSELLLFDGDDGGDRDESSEEDDDAVIFRSAAAKRRRKAKMGQRQSSAHAFPFATDFAGMPEIDPYGDFDVMDRDRPSLKKTPNNRQNVPVFELSDIELEASLKLQWEKDRSRKKMRKKEREELHAQGLLGNKGQPDLKARYKEGISFAEVKHEVIEFMISDRQR